jgi:hypothetical protein
MPLDLSYFLLVLEKVADHANGFDPPALAMVEAAWQMSAAAARMFGWVVMLGTGQRLYLEMEVTGAGHERQTDLEITPLPKLQRYPDELEDAAWYRPDHINRHLGLVERFVH